MRVRDWRAHGGLDVLVHALGGGAALDDEVMRSVMEARGLLLADAARLAAERRDDDQAALLARLAGEVAAARRRRGRAGRGLRVLRDADRGVGQPRAAAGRQLDPRPLLRPAGRLPRARARPRRRWRASTPRPRPRSPTATPRAPRGGRRAHRRAGGRLAGGAGVRRREARAVAALVDAVAAPEPPLPPVADTDAVAVVRDLDRLAPQPNRAVLHAALGALALARFARARPRRPARAAAAPRALPARGGPARHGRGELLRRRGRAARARPRPARRAVRGRGASRAVAA